jgi:hypothetical protein
MPTEAATAAAPPGAFLELDIDLIDEGKFSAYVMSKIRQLYDGLDAYEKESGDMTAKATATIKVTVQRLKGSTQSLDLSYRGKAEVPVVTRSTIVKVANGKMLCQPAGSSADDPNQQLFYDAVGRIIGAFDPAKGEVLGRDEAQAANKKHVAGVIGKAANG